MAKNFKVLGVESSCDESGLALYCSEGGLLGEQLYSQVATHAHFGGVVPELASRDHIRKIALLIKRLMKSLSTELSEIDAVAYTAGPGLMGSLFVGATLATSLAMALNKPTIAVHHLEGHLLAPLMGASKPEYPFLALLVSGGHTQLFAVRGYRQYQLLGESLDDAAGEAFDKAAKMLGLPYPGGPALAKLADKIESSRLVFPRPMIGKPGLDFSFSGLKTYTRNAIEAEKGESGTLTEEAKAEIAAAFQCAVVETLAIKCRRAVEQTGINRVVLSGGVAANRALREKLSSMRELDCFYPPLSLCTDNGAMIAFAGCLAYQQLGESVLSWHRAVQIKARWPLTDLAASGRSV